MIIHLITNFTASAGAETMLARLLQDASGEPAMVVSLGEISDRNRNLIGNPNVPLIALGAKGPVSLFAAIWRLAFLIRRQRPRIVVCWMYHAMIAGTVATFLCCRKPFVFWNVRQSMDDITSLSRSSRAAIAICRLLSRRAKGFIYNSSRALEMHGQYGYSNHNAVVIPNGFQLPENAMSRGTSRMRIGIAARFHPQKDHETFFRAAAYVSQTHPDVRFVVAGKGLEPGNSSAVELVEKAGLPLVSVELVGEIHDMARFYRSLDLFVLSSRTEGFPNVLAEAMSYSIPVVTTDVGDAACVAGDAGLVVPSRNPEAMAEAIRWMLDADQPTYAQFARRARLRIEANYTLEAVRLHYADFFHRSAR